MRANDKSVMCLKYNNAIYAEKVANWETEVRKYNKGKTKRNTKESYNKKCKGKTTKAKTIKGKTTNGKTIKEKL